MTSAHRRPDLAAHAEPPTDAPNAVAKVSEINSSRVPPLVPGGSIYFKVETKVAAVPRCAEGQIDYFAPEPTPAGYCLTCFEL